MALAIKGTPNAAAATSVTIPAHAVGDVIVIYAYRDGSTTVPSKPASGGTVPAWVDIDAANGANTNSSRTAQFRATATNHTSGTWTNATGMVALVLSGAAGIGGHAESGGASANAAQAPAVTLTRSDGTSQILRFYGHRTVTAWSAAPTGYTRQASVATEVCLNSQNTTTTAAAVNQSNTATNSGYRGATVEVLAAPLASTLTDSFNTQDTSKWTFGAGASVTGGQLVCPPNTAFSSYALTTSAYCLTGSSISVELVQNPAAGNGTIYTYFVASASSTGSWNDSERFYINNGTLYMDEGFGGTINPTSITYSPTDHRFLRLRESGGTVYWDTSPDGMTWTNQRSLAKSTSTDAMYVLLQSAYTGTESPINAIFDNVNTAIGGSLTVTASPTATAAFAIGASSTTVTATSTAAATNAPGIAGSLAETAAASADAQRGHNATASAAVTATPTGAVTGAMVGAATTSVSATPSGVIQRTQFVDTSQTVTATPAGSASTAGVASATLAGTATATAAATRTHNASALLTVTAAPTGAVTADLAADAQLAETVSPHAAAARTQNAATTLPLTATLSGTGNTDTTIAADASVIATLDGDVQRGHNATTTQTITTTPSGTVTTSAATMAALEATAAMSADGDVEVGGTDQTATTNLLVTAHGSANVVDDTTTGSASTVTAATTGTASRGQDADSPITVTVDAAAAAMVIKHAAANLAAATTADVDTHRTVTVGASLNVAAESTARSGSDALADADVAVAVILEAEAVVSSAISADLELLWAVSTGAALPPPVERITSIPPALRDATIPARTAEYVVSEQTRTALLEPRPQPPVIAAASRTFTVEGRP